MKVITCNIRFSSMGNDFNERSWKERHSLCAKTILDSNPDVICLQECHNDQFRDLSRDFGDGFTPFWINTFPDGSFPENAIYYKRNRFETIGHGGYWLSETPHIAGSKSWQSECVRFVNYVVLNDGNGPLRIVNTHFDHASQEAREHQVEMVNADAAAWDEIPQLLTGDFNCDCTNPAFQLLLNAGWRDTYREANPEENPPFTYHDFLGDQWNGNLGPCGNGKMDFILCKGKLVCKKSEVIKTHRGKVFPSDHYFVCAEIDPAQQNEPAFVRRPCSADMRKGNAEVSCICCPTADGDSLPPVPCSPQ